MFEFESLFYLLIKIAFDFTCLCYFISNSNKAFIQIRMPTLTLILVFLLEILSIIDTFLKFDTSGVNFSISCTAYGITYSYLPSSILLMYTIFACRILNQGNVKDRKYTNTMKSICMLISGINKDSHFWDNPSFLKKIKRRKMLILFLLFVLPGTIDYCIYTLIVGTTSNSSGAIQCRSWGHFFTIVVGIILVIFSVSVLNYIKFDTDIFKIRNSFFMTTLATILYGLVWVVGVVGTAIDPAFQLSRVYYNVFNSLIIFSWTVYPVLLSKRKLTAHLDIQDILRNKNSWNAFVTLCSSSCFGQYALYVEDIHHLDMKKPLQVQKFIKKYFDPDSPFYLDLQSWYIDTTCPDQYTLMMIEKYVLSYLQVNFLVYMKMDDLNVNLDLLKIQSPILRVQIKNYV
eukprot:NODE_24_length_41419_cov_0.818780.p8 type:complete len:401 gc:universal NODE_24_length_41419_cov_0.818780:8276-7074(-)